MIVKIIKFIYGIFDNDSNLKEGYLACDINEGIERILNYENIVCCGTGAILHKELLIEKIPKIKFAKENFQIAFATGLIGYKKYLENNLKNADTILPSYLRKSRSRTYEIY